MIDEYGYNQPPGGTQQPDPGQQSQYGYAQQQNQYGYGQQQAAYTPHPSGQYGYGYAVSNAQQGKGSGWITFFRVILWVWFSVLCIVGICTCIYFFDLASRYSSFVYHYSEEITELQTLGIAVLLSCVLIACLSLAGGMVAADHAANAKRSATNTALILDELKKK